MRQLGETPYSHFGRTYRLIREGESLAREYVSTSIHALRLFISWQRELFSRQLGPYDLFMLASSPCMLIRCREALPRGTSAHRRASIAPQRRAARALYTRMAQLSTGPGEKVKSKLILLYRISGRPLCSKLRQGYGLNQ